MSEMLLTAYDGAILGPIAKVLGWLMNGIYFLMSLIGIENVGLAIIIFTIVIYTFMFPLTYKQQKFSKLSQKMQPELQKINKKYENRKDQASMMAMQEETQAVYQKYGVSMMGSCGQMLIQMPLLFALYRVFQNVPAYVNGVKDIFSELVSGIMSTDGFAAKMAQLVTDLNIYTSPRANFDLANTAENSEALGNYIVDVLYKMGSAGWENNLTESFPALSDTIASTYDKVSHVNSFLMLNISDTPWYLMKTNAANGSYLLVILALMIPVLSYVTQVMNIKMTSQSQPEPSSKNKQNDTMANQMQMMNKTMPLFSLVMCFTVPVGLGIYWVASALVRWVQQIILNRHFEKIDLEDIIKKNQEKAKKKREKSGIKQNQIYAAANINARQVEDARRQAEADYEKREQLEKLKATNKNTGNNSTSNTGAKAGSMAAKANMVREYNEKNNRK